jgi:hypothetical protein
MTRAILALALGLLLPAVACEPAASPLPAPGPNAIEIVVKTDPPGGTVIVDGAAIGPAPQTVRLNPGPHRLRASMSGYYPAPETKIQVGAEGPREVVLTLVASH